MSKKRLTTLISLLALLSLGTLPNPVQAEPVTGDLTISTEPESIPDIFSSTLTHNSGNYFDSVSFEGQFNLIFGFNQFPENQVSRDAELISIFTQDLIRQQVNPVPLRTRDLANPYQSSLQQEPSYHTPFTP